MAEMIKNVDIKEVTKNITLEIKITGYKMYKVRLWLVGLIMRLAAFVMPIHTDVEIIEKGRVSKC